MPLSLGVWINEHHDFGLAAMSKYEARSSGARDIYVPDSCLSVWWSTSRLTPLNAALPVFDAFSLTSFDLCSNTARASMSAWGGGLISTQRCELKVIDFHNEIHAFLSFDGNRPLFIFMFHMGRRRCGGRQETFQGLNKRRRGYNNVFKSFSCEASLEETVRTLLHLRLLFFCNLEQTVFLRCMRLRLFT